MKYITIALLLGCVLLSGCENNKSQTMRIESPTQVTEEQVTSSEKHHEAAIEAINHQKYDAAKEHLIKAIRDNPFHIKAHNNLGMVYFHNKNYYQAAWHYQKAIEIVPNRAEPHNNLGLVYETVGKLDQAVDHYRIAANIAKDKIEYVCNLARAMVKRGDKTEGLKIHLKSIIDSNHDAAWSSWANTQLIKLDQ